MSLGKCELVKNEISRADKIRSCHDNLWFEGFVGIDYRVTVTKLPENFGEENWEYLDASLSDEPTVDIDSDQTNQFYVFKLETESGFDYPHENEIGFSICDMEGIGNDKRHN
jgi:hypothetical protein